MTAFKKWLDDHPFMIDTGREEKVAKLAWDAALADKLIALRKVREKVEARKEFHNSRHEDGANEYNTDKMADAAGYMLECHKILAIIDEAIKDIENE
jgi:hypothetical protein